MNAHILICRQEWVLVTLRTGLFATRVANALVFPRGEGDSLRASLKAQCQKTLTVIYDDSHDYLPEKEIISCLGQEGYRLQSVSVSELIQDLIQQDFRHGALILLPGRSGTFMGVRDRSGWQDQRVLPSDHDTPLAELMSRLNEFNQGVPLVLSPSLARQSQEISSQWNGAIYDLGQLPAVRKLPPSGAFAEEYRLLIGICMMNSSRICRGPLALTSAFHKLLLFLVLGLLVLLAWFFSRASKPVVGSPVVVSSEDKRQTKLFHPICPLRFHGREPHNQCGQFSACNQTLVLCPGEMLGDWKILEVQKELARIQVMNESEELWLSAPLDLSFPSELLHAVRVNQRIEAVAREDIPSLGLQARDQVNGLLGRQFASEQDILELEQLLRSGMEFVPNREK